MSKRELVKRYALFIVSLFFSALGVAFTRHGGLGVTPISSIPNVMNCKFPAVSLGTWLIIWNCTLPVLLFLPDRENAGRHGCKVFYQASAEAARCSSG